MVCWPAQSFDIKQLSTQGMQIQIFIAFCYADKRKKKLRVK